MHKKKLFSLIISLILLLSTVTVCVTAEPLSAGDDALRAEFQKSSGGGLEYCYYAPENLDGTKYPLFVFLHGIASGSYNGDQVDSYDLCKWASDEYQSRFYNAGGCWILCPKALGTWDLTSVETVRSCIDSFVDTHSGSIDKSRIYISGFSLGASMCIKVAAAYPELFAACLPISPLEHTDSSMEALSNMLVWFFACDKDIYPTATTLAVRTAFNSLKNSASDKSKVLFTHVSTACYEDGSAVDVQHYMWRTLTNDMFTSDGSTWPKAVTEDGNGNIVDFTYPDGIIARISKVTNETNVDTAGKITFMSKIRAFFQKIIDFFRSLFNK